MRKEQKGIKSLVILDVSEAAWILHSQLPGIAKMHLGALITHLSKVDFM